MNPRIGIVYPILLHFLLRYLNHKPLLGFISSPRFFPSRYPMYSISLKLLFGNPFKAQVCIM